MKRAVDEQINLTQRLSISEQEARKQHAQFLGVFDSAPEAIVLTNFDRQITMVNPAFMRLFGYELSEAIDTDCSEIVARPATSGPDIFSLNQDEMRIGFVADPVMSAFRRKDGTTFQGEALVAPYFDIRGTPVGLVAVIRDLTSKLQLEESRRNSQKLEALGQLTGGIAHDFNNILTTLVGNLEFVDPHLKDPEGRTALRRATNAAEMAARLTTRLLTFARRRKLEPMVVDLNGQVIVIADLLRRALGDSISLDLDLSDGLWPVRVDISEFENSIVNLALNARDAMPSGGRLTIQTRNLEIAANEEQDALSPGEYVALSVNDTGTGMPPDVARRAFEPFFSTKGSGHGTGLGLSTVYGFTEQSGGKVSLRTALGRGACVRLLLPRAKSEPTAPSNRGLPPLSENAEVVLVVEDDTEVRESVMQRVEGLGYVAIEAANGREAIEFLKTPADVDLVFSDVSMPGGVTGYDIAAWVFANRPNVRILLTSGHIGEIEPPQPLVARGIEVLDKPYDRHALAEALARAFKQEIA